MKAAVVLLALAGLVACGKPAPVVDRPPAKPTAAPELVPPQQETEPPAHVLARAQARTVWDVLADCESGEWDRHGQPIEGTARWDIVSPPHFGGVQFTLQSWEWVGGAGLPSDATRAEQIARAELLLERQGWDAWPVCSRMIGVADG